MKNIAATSLLVVSTAITACGSDTFVTPVPQAEVTPTTSVAAPRLTIDKYVANQILAGTFMRGPNDTLNFAFYKTDDKLRVQIMQGEVVIYEQVSDAAGEITSLRVGDIDVMAIDNGKQLSAADRLYLTRCDQRDLACYRDASNLLFELVVKESKILRTVDGQQAAFGLADVKRILRDANARMDTCVATEFGSVFPCR